MYDAMTTDQAGCVSNFSTEISPGATSDMSSESSVWPHTSADDGQLAVLEAVRAAASRLLVFRMPTAGTSRTTPEGSLDWRSTKRLLHLPLDILKAQGYSAISN